MASSYTQSLSNGIVDYQNTKRLVSGLLPRLSLLQWAMPGDLTMNKDADTWGVEILQAVHNTDISDYPTPIISKRLQSAFNSTETVITSQKVTRQLGFYSGHFKFDIGTKSIKSGQIDGDLMKQFQLKGAADIAKLAVRTFKGIDAVAANNVYAGSATSDADAEEQIGIDDIIQAYYALADYDWQPYSEIRDVSNNYNLVRTPEYYVLEVHESQVAGMLANMIEGQHYIPAKDFKSEDPNEICRIVPVPVRVIKTKWIETAEGGVATSGMKQANSVNIIYHARMHAAESWAFPSLGKKVSVKIEREGGKQDARPMFQGVNIKMWPKAQMGPADPDGIWEGGTLQYWSGDTADGEGGLLIPRYDDTGTARYGVVKIHATARSYS